MHWIRKITNCNSNQKKHLVFIKKEKQKNEPIIEQELEMFVMGKEWFF